MNNHDLLDTIGDLSEETVHKYALPDSRNTERAKEEDIMDTSTQPIRQTKKKPFRISMGAAAAAIAVCVGLNAAILFGIHKMKQDAAGMSSDAVGFSEEYKMPDLIGVNYEEAMCQWGDVLQIVMDSEEYSDYEEGRIFDQDVAPGEPLSKDMTVHVKVSLGQKKVLLPDVTDWEFETAKQTIFGLGLYVDKRMSYSSEVEKGRVISTDPEGPVEIEPGSYVRVTVSLGKNPDTVPVPNFVNMDWDTAKNIADSLNLELVKKQIFDEAEKGTVLNQSVQPTEEVAEGSVIELTVSTGAGYEGILVPKFVGMQWELAETTANALKIANTKKVVDDDAPAGTVIAQDVDPGTVPDENTLVTLTVSSGQKQEAVRISFNVPAGAAGKYHIALYESGAAKAIGGQFDPEYAAGVTSLVIEGSGTAEMTAVLFNDGNEKQTVIGTYRVDFENRSYETISEDIAAAYEKVQ